MFMFQLYPYCPTQQELSTWLNQTHVSQFTNSPPSLTNDRPSLINGPQSLNDVSQSSNNDPPSLNGNPQSLNSGPPSLNNGPSLLSKGFPSSNNRPLSLNNGHQSLNSGPPSLNNGPPWLNNARPTLNNPPRSSTHFNYPSKPDNSNQSHHVNITKDPKTFSNDEVVTLLDKNTNALKQLQVNDQQQQQQLPILMDAVIKLIHVPKQVLVSSLQNEFFALLQTSLIDILNDWCRRPSPLSENESFMFRITVKLIRKLVKVVEDTKFIPSWLSDSTLLESISNCLIDISISEKYFNENNQKQFKSFTYLIDAYIHYQQRLNYEQHTQKDKLVQLLDPILHCLTSSHFIRTFDTLSTDTKSMTTTGKFFLVKCTAFLISYNGSRLEQTMENLLKRTLPQYTRLLDKVVSSANNWKRPIIRSVEHLIRMIDHGADDFSINAKLVSEHLSIIDHVLQLINTPIFYNNLQETLSNLETIFIDTSIRFLVNMIDEPAILAHIKQCQVVDRFLRLTSCKYEPLVFNIYTLLAYTTREEDIKAMHNPGRLLLTILKSIKTTLDRTPDDQVHKEQLLETLKGLVQHDQMKDEILKQNALPFLFECANKLTDKSHTLVLEVLWSLTFNEQGAQALRSNPAFLNKIQMISTNSNDEALKKAADGLVWKLIRQPAFLEKVARQEAEDQNAVEGAMETIVEEIVNERGEKEYRTVVKPVAESQGERIFQYDMMISYCHADKDLVYKIHKFLLNQGFKIWIDLDNMYGPAMSAMADAVENSEFVLMCMSDSYKQSTYCQAEAEYAFNCKRRLIPLIVRQGYRPDGWLGFMIGSRIYVDFGRFDFSTACDKLMIEISHQRKQPLPSKQVAVTSHQIPTKTEAISSNPKMIVTQREKPLVTYDNHAFAAYTRRKPSTNFTKKSIYQWTESDVLDFLFTERLIQLMPLCETMDGRALVLLYRMGISRSGKTFQLLDNELNATHKMKLSLKIFTRFLSAVEQRVISQPSMSFPKVSKFPINPQQDVSYPAKPYLVNSASYSYTSYPPKTSFINDVPSKYLLESSRTSVVNYDSTAYPSYPDKPYDLIITSNASPLAVLKALQRHGPNFFKSSPSLANYQF